MKLSLACMHVFVYVCMYVYDGLSHTSLRWKGQIDRRPAQMPATGAET